MMGRSACRRRRRGCSRGVTRGRRRRRRGGSGDDGAVGCCGTSDVEAGAAIGDGPRAAGADRNAAGARELRRREVGVRCRRDAVEPVELEARGAEADARDEAVDDGGDAPRNEVREERVGSAGGDDGAPGGGRRRSRSGRPRDEGGAEGLRVVRDGRGHFEDGVAESSVGNRV
jgi:hypothetical protein